MNVAYSLSPPRAWAEINLSALLENLNLARELSGSALMVVVKAGAYGHGLEDIANLLDAEDIAFFGVANVGEARRLRNLGVRTKIYLLGPTWAGEREEIVACDWIPCLSSLTEAAHFDALASAANKRLLVHLAVDTGMGRGGFLLGELPDLMQKLEEFKHLEIDGIGSHLPSADEDEVFTRQQIACYRDVVQALGGEKRFKWRHLLNSAGLIGYDKGLCNLSRPGLMLYGASTLPLHYGKLSTVMTLKSRVTLLRKLPAGHGVSYGRQFVTSRSTRVATIGIGYGDGYPRHISGHGGEVFLHGQRCPILGRVTMDQLMVDATDLVEVSEGDEVELFGPNIPVTEVADKSGTIAWEIFTGITPRVQRCYVHHS